MHSLTGETVLITGGSGSIGHALIPQVLAAGARELRILSRDEVKQAVLKTAYPQVRCILGDVRDLRACHEAARGATIVIHAASLKYIDLSEQQPTEYALTNVLGTINMIQAALHAGVARMVGISTDKCCLPINAYGLTKGLLEKFFMESHTTHHGAESGTAFVVCRYGNVIASRGSVILKWQAARQQGQPIQVTDPTMTRFFFTLTDAVALIDVALAAPSGLIVSKAMPSATLGDLAAVMAGPAGVTIIGRRPGEKPHEDLLSAHEMPRVTRDGDLFYYDPLMPTPHKRPGLPYTSANARRLTRDELTELTAPWR